MQAAGRHYIWHPSRSDTIKLWNISDVHLLSRGCDEQALERDLAAISEDPHSFWIGGGDYAEFIGNGDKRFDPSSVAEWVPLKKLGDLAKYSMEIVRDYFMPIRHKCLGLLLGNHEYKCLQHNAQQGLHSWLCEELGVRNLGYSAMFHLIFVRTSRTRKPVLKASPPINKHCAWGVRVFAHHGAGGGGTPGGKLNRLGKFMDAFDCDLAFMGHIHENLVLKQPVLGINADGTRIVQRQRLGLVAGSYLKTYIQDTTSYGEMKGYRPAGLGASVAELHPDTQTMRAAV